MHRYADLARVPGSVRSQTYDSERYITDESEKNIKIQYDAILCWSCKFVVVVVAVVVVVVNIVAVVVVSQMLKLQLIRMLTAKKVYINKKTKYIIYYAHAVKNVKNNKSEIAITSYPRYVR